MKHLLLITSFISITTVNSFAQNKRLPVTDSLKNDTVTVIQLTPAQANSLLQLYYQLGITAKDLDAVKKMFSDGIKTVIDKHKTIKK